MYEKIVLISVLGMVGGDRNLFVRKGGSSKKWLGNTGLTWKALHTKRCKRHFHFWNFSKYKTCRKKWGGHGILYPTWKSGGNTSPVSPTKLRPCSDTLYNRVLKLKLLRRPLWRCRNNGGTWTLLETGFTYCFLIKVSWLKAIISRCLYVLLKGTYSLASRAILNSCE